MRATENNKIQNGVLWKSKLICVYAACAILDIGFSVASLAAFAILYPFSKLRFLTISAMLQSSLRVMFFKFIPRLGLYEIEIDGDVSALEKSRGVIFIANHTTWLDPLIMLALAPRAGILLKSKYVRHVIFVLSKIFDFISVDEGDIGSAEAAVRRSEEVLRDGKNLIIFPEGRRSISSRLLDFKRLAFKLSKDCRMPIRPVAIHFSPIIYGKRNTKVFPLYRSKVTIEILAPLNPEDFRDAETLSAHAYRAISRAISNIEKKIIL